MLKMSVKKNEESSPREGTASAVREAVRSGVPERATSPERSKRRVFTAEYKLRIVREADEALESGGEGSVGALLRPGGQLRCRVRRARRWGGGAAVLGDLLVGEGVAEELALGVRLAEEGEADGEAADLAGGDGDVRVAG